MSHLKRLGSAWKRFMSFNLNSYLNSLPISKQARVKIPVGLGLFFLCWLASEQIKIHESKPIMEAVPLTPPEFILPKSRELIEGVKK